MSNEDDAHKAAIMLQHGTPEQQDQAERWAKGETLHPPGMRVEYIDHMGTDARVVDAARVSFHKRKEGTALDEKDVRLISYLAKHNHFTPFTHPQVTLVYRVPLFVARQEFKHIVGFTRNEVSRRYVDDMPELFKPDGWRERPEQGIKQGSGGYLDPELTEEANELLKLLEEEAIHAYDSMLALGVAPEQARMVLPQNMMTEYMITGSLYAYTRMFKLRNDPHAQYEIRQLANMVEATIYPLFPHSWEALVGNDNEQ